MIHLFPFDPTYGYDIPALLRVGSPPAPSDFEEFWRDTYSQARRIPLNISHRQISHPFDVEFDVFEVEYDSLGSVRIGAWLMIPRGRNISRGIVFGHGYGGREEPERDWFAGPPAAGIFPCARGFHRSARPDYPSNAAEHVLHGIESRETYSHRGCVADYWLAASALLELVPECASCIDYMGGSFGGGIGAMMLPWDHRFRKAMLDVPSFGNHPLRVTLECNGSGESVRRRYQVDSGILNALQYFDAATAARFIRIPTFVGAATFDPSVPPPGQFAVYNAIQGPKELFVREAAHFEWSGQAEEDQRLLGMLGDWFR